MSEIPWVASLDDARQRAVDDGRLLLTYVYSPT